MFPSGRLPHRQRLDQWREIAEFFAAGRVAAHDA
jgi:hypothetical protein